MRKPVQMSCLQQKCRSVCTSGVSGQHLCCSLLGSIVSIFAKFKIPSVAEQTSLVLHASQNPKDRFSHDVAQMRQRTAKLTK